MDQIAIENCSIVSAKESLPEFGIDDRQGYSDLLKNSDLRGYYERIVGT